MKFVYHAHNSSGNSIKASCQADSLEEVKERVKKMGYSIINISNENGDVIYSNMDSNAVINMQKNMAEKEYLTTETIKGTIVTKDEIEKLSKSIEIKALTENHNIMNHNDSMHKLVKEEEKVQKIIFNRAEKAVNEAQLLLDKKKAKVINVLMENDQKGSLMVLIVLEMLKEESE